MMYAFNSSARATAASKSSAPCSPPGRTRATSPPAGDVALVLPGGEQGAEDFEAAVARAEELKAYIIKPRHRSENAHWECWLRDPDGYTIVLSSPLGSAPD